MRTLTFSIKVFIFLFVVNLQAQKTSKKETPKDSVVYKTGYGLRLGIDLSKPGLSFIDKSYTGFEIVGDYRVSKNWYIAGEIGREEEITFEDFTTSTSKGNYIRLGANLNTYTNWLDMNNEVYVGGRYGLAIFEHTLNNFTPNISTGNPDIPIIFPNSPVNTPVSESGLTAHWFEFQIGIKVETFKNLFIGFHGAYKIGLSIDDQENFKTLYAPGFNRVFESNTGFGFNYTISYLIPFVNK
ncbi:DUF6048 family protein [Tenacibaculum jejuense]|uniref:Outer membrane protein beta-barrel domain-containing protein n=1 Tax=Tenacibaculum jejuense TaxID=584609 RepID=A0A238UCS9_9FLAO|nr:DUF6048 family protein [Tenacibaculum jejuense]SNR16378.1 conserved protein of unknown function [Tenacibaculum jejuense]